jgi:hypothetical protein
VHLDHLAAGLPESLRGEQAGRAIAGVDHHLEGALGPGPGGQILDVSPADALDPAVFPGGLAEPAGLDDLPELLDLFGLEGLREPLGQLHAGPAVLVMAGRDHGSGGDIEVVLGEVQGRGQQQPHVHHARPGGHQAECEGVLDLLRIGPIVMSHHHLGVLLESLEMVEQPGPEGLAQYGHPGVVQLWSIRLGQSPADVILPEPGGLDQGFVEVIG